MSNKRLKIRSIGLLSTLVVIQIRSVKVTPIKERNQTKYYNLQTTTIMPKGNTRLQIPAHGEDPQCSKSLSLGRGDRWSTFEVECESRSCDSAVLCLPLGAPIHCEHWEEGDVIV